MASETFSAYHEFVATVLAREMNAYFSHSKRMEEYFAQRDIRGNQRVYRNQDRSNTEELRLKVIILAATYVEGNRSRLKRIILEELLSVVE